MISAIPAVLHATSAPQPRPANPAGQAAAATERAAAPPVGGMPPGQPLDLASALTAQAHGEHDPHGDGLSEEERAEVRHLKKEDVRVRRHEQAHAAVGGAHAGSPSYTFETGPDGRAYAVSGTTPIDVSPVSGDPAATIRKMDTVKRAALAPADPSGQDRAVAARAEAEKAKAQAELADERAKALASGAAPGRAVDIAA